MPILAGGIRARLDTTTTILIVTGENSGVTTPSFAEIIKNSGVISVRTAGTKPPEIDEKYGMIAGSCDVMRGTRAMIDIPGGKVTLLLGEEWSMPNSSSSAYLRISQ